ncbi:MAG: hypothetical protein KatS3mg087_1040 [Patescibacteria group bacterium]|nr:MAG: hypothetical protein KatS3mg087_1040 [Patescibacteria group bacterium]
MRPESSVLENLWISMRLKHFKDGVIQADKLQDVGKKWFWAVVNEHNGNEEESSTSSEVDREQPADAHITA